MESARQVFVTRGFPDATVDDIAREAGASRATFYLHFRSKVDIAAALVAEGMPFAVAQCRTLDKLLCDGGLFSAATRTASRVAVEMAGHLDRVGRRVARAPGRIGAGARAGGAAPPAVRYVDRHVGKLLQPARRAVPAPPQLLILRQPLRP